MHASWVEVIAGILSKSGRCHSDGGSSADTEGGEGRCREMRLKLNVNVFIVAANNI